MLRGTAGQRRRKDFNVDAFARVTIECLGTAVAFALLD
jgi:hypothetical protein|eukprot:COSAG03_NODE_225_length_10336_cov_715.603888_7_plen_38_part_00